MANKQRFDIEIGAQVDPSVRKAASNAQSILGSIVGGNLISSGIQAAIGGIQSMASGALDTYREYQKSMANTAGIAGITDKSSADFQKLSEAAEAAGKATAFTSAQAGDALGYMSLAGWDVNKSTKALMPVLKLAEATGADLAGTANLVTGSMNAMGVSFDNMDDLNGYFDVLVKANNKSATTAGELMEAFTGVGGAAKAAGQDYKTTATALGILANANTKGAVAGTALNSILVRMTSKKEAMNAYKKLGVNIYDAAGNTRNFGDILKDTNKAMAGMTEEQKNSYLAAIAGTNYYSTYNQLLEGVNKTVDGSASAWDKLSGEIQNSDNALDTMHDTTTDTVDYSFAKLESALQDVQLQFLKAFGSDIQKALDYVSGTVLPAVSKAAENLGNFIQDPVIVKFGELKGMLGDVKDKFGEFTDFLSEHQEVIAAAAWVVGGLATAILIYNGAMIARAATDVGLTIGIGLLYAWDTAAAIATGVTTALGVAFKFLTSPLTLIILGFAAAMAASILLYKNWDTVKEKLVELWQKIQEVGSNVMNAMSEWWDYIMQCLDQNFVQPWNTFWDSVGEKVSAVWQGIKNAVKSGINSVINLINVGIGQLNKFQVNVPKGVPIVGGKHVGLNIPTIPTLATGGIATGPTLAEIGEGGEPEAVVPLTKLSNMLNGGVGGGITYSPNIVINGNADKSEISEAMRSSYEEFKEFMDRYTSERRRLAF
nr:MAG TPA: minor tail protein [Caudoviricetes sp.]